MPFEDSALEEYALDLDPELATLGELASLDVEPVVMVNLLKFRDAAVGDGFEGLTGREAYEQYVVAIADTQAEIGSRLIWSGDVHSQVVGSSDPVFQSAGLLEYESISSFLGYAASIPAEAEAARAAGLEGQWLVAARTLSEDAGALGSNDCGSWSAEEIPNATGLSDAQVRRLFEAGSEGPLVTVELTRSVGGGIDAYLDAMLEVQTELGARRRWQGELMLQVIGTGSPAFEGMVVTEYPSRDCFVEALADDRVTGIGESRAEDTELHWVYSAVSGSALDVLPD